MKKGTLSERYLNNSILMKLSGAAKEDIRSGIGNDYSVTDGIVSADGTGYDPYVAWNKAVNNYACSGGRPACARIQMILPEKVKESHISGYMDVFTELSKEMEISIAGGHTEVSGDITSPWFCVTVTGIKCEWNPNSKLARMHGEIVMAGEAATLGTDILINRCADLANRFDRGYLNSIKHNTDDYSVLRTVNHIINFCPDDIYYLHDISSGGVYSALWQLGKWCGSGIEIINRQIPINQGTIEICEYLDINPYLIDATGSILVICRDGFNVVSELKKHNIKSAVIGKVTDGKERKVIYGENDVRTLAPVTVDDIYNM